MKQPLLALVTLASTLLISAQPAEFSLLSPVPLEKKADRKAVLAEHILDLTMREPSPYANEVFSDNILLALHYLNGEEFSPQTVDWQVIHQPFEASFALQSGEVFAFHNNVLPEFDLPTSGPAVTMNARFFIEEGYRSVGCLGGNGVCHLASLINWTASEAGLAVVAKTNHNFAPVPGVPREYGTSIRSQSPNQNLYVENNLDFPVSFHFQALDQQVKLSVLQ